MKEIKKTELAVFDLDGTITFKDTYVEVVKYHHGWLISKFAYGFLLCNVLLLRLEIIDNNHLKRNVVKRFFKGKSKESLMSLGVGFAKDVLPKISYRDAMEQISWHQQQGHRVVVLTASCDFWLQYWAESMKLELIATELQYVNGKFKGELATSNCYGKEKVTRLKERFPEDEFIYAYGYGDTASDLHFMKMMMNSHMCKFKNRG